ncbi:Eco57I restriction-modification methylase domain-containing protein [Ekhidna sp.]
MTELEQEIKHTGATFTPESLATFLAEKIAKYSTLDSNQISVLDPSCGDGELLLAMGKLLCSQKNEFLLRGCDLNLKYLEESTNRLNQFTNVDLIEGDFLEAISLTDQNKQIDLFTSDEVSNTLNNSADIIIANPPYVRTQILGAEKAQLLAKKFGLTGRVDLYYPFLIAMTESLVENGILGVITSNRYLSTKGGESIRKYLVDNYEILEVIDLGDTKLFNAAVLPAIFIGKKKSKIKGGILKEGSFTKVYEELNGISPTHSSADIYELLNENESGCYSILDKKFNLSKGSLRYTTGTKDLWQMLSDAETEWVHRLEDNSQSKVKDHFKVRVGVKTTADSVFVRDDWNELSQKPESEILYPLITQQNIGKWSLDDKLALELLYTHYDENGKKKVIDLKKYPNAANYLEQHKKELSARTYVIKAKRNWFEIWVPQNPALWKLPKLVFPDISVEPRFYLDNSGSVVNGNCYWIAAEDRNQLDILYLLQGVANSSIMIKYHDLIFNNKLYSGRRRYFSQYVENYPLPDECSSESKAVIKLIKELNANKPTHDIKTQSKLDKLVTRAFGLD